MFLEPHETLQDYSSDGKGNIDIFHLHDQDSTEQIRPRKARRRLTKGQTIKPAAGCRSSFLSQLEGLGLQQTRVLNRSTHECDLHQ